MAVGLADFVVTMVVGEGEVIAALSAATREAGRPRTKRRWLQMSCMLLRCLDVVIENCSGCWCKVEDRRKNGRIYAIEYLGNAIFRREENQIL